MSILRLGDFCPCRGGPRPAAELGPPAPVEQRGAGGEPQAERDPDPGQAECVEAQHQRRGRDVGHDGENHRAAHRDVVGQAEDEAVEDERERGQRLGDGGHQQGDQGGVPHGRIRGEQDRDGERQGRGEHAQAGPGDQAQPDGAPPDPVRAAGIAGAEAGADVHLGGHGQRVERQREQEPDAHGDLLAAERDGPEPGRDRGRGEGHHAERDRADRQAVTVLQQGFDFGPAGPARADLGPAPGGGGVQGGGGHLGGYGAPRRADQAEVQGVDQEQFESDVQKIGGDGDPERGPGVGEPDQVAVPGVGEVQEGQARGGNAQVGHGTSQDELVRAEQVREPGRGDEQGGRDGGPGGRGDQVGGAGGAARLLGGPGRGQARYRRGRRGGQEDRQPGRHVQRGAGDGQRVERDAAQVADDGRVDEAVRGLGGDRPEGGQGESRDAPV